MAEKQNYNILYVDDDEQNLFIFHRILDKYYNIITVNTSIEALEIIANKQIHVILADQRMPDLNGVQLLNRVMIQFPQIIRILVTGYSDIDVVIDAINKGSVYRYIPKPWDNEDVIRTVQNAVELYALKQKNTSLMEELDLQNKKLHQKVLELDFLNDLQLELKGYTNWDDITKMIFKRIKDKLRAESGCYGKINSAGEPVLNLFLCENTSFYDFSSATEKIIEKYKTADPCIIPDSNLKKTVYIPLDFQEQNFGFLLFRIEENKINFGLPFLRAISYVAASILFSFYSNKKNVEKERFFILGQMASMIVHDLKGPIHTITGFASILGRDLSTDQRMKYSGILQEELTRLADTVEELLDFAKGKKHLSLKTIDLKEYIPEILKIFNFSLKEANITLFMDIKPELQLNADPQKLKKVFINLMNNAIEFLSDYKGNREIKISAYKNNNTVMIKQQNTGPEIPEAVARKLFDPFFSYKKQKGTGLGLTICKKIIEEHNGTISVYSQKGYTTFTISIPHSEALSKTEELSSAS